MEKQKNEVVVTNEILDDIMELSMMIQAKMENGEIRLGAHAEVLGVEAYEVRGKIKEDIVTYVCACHEAGETVQYADFLDKWYNDEGFWFTEVWSEEDIINALLAAKVSCSTENIEYLKETCARMFDKYDERNEILFDEALRLKEGQRPEYLIFISDGPEDAPWEGKVYDTLSFRKREALPCSRWWGLMFQLYDKNTGERIGYGKFNPLVVKNAIEEWEEGRNTENECDNDEEYDYED